MKKIIVFAFIMICSINTEAMLVEFVENGVTTNRFLSEYAGGTCPLSTGTTSTVWGVTTATSGNSTTDCGNSYIYKAININFAQGSMTGLGTYYIYNNFGMYIQAMSQALNNAKSPEVNNTSDSFSQALQNTKDEIATNMTSGVSNDAGGVTLSTAVSDAYKAYAGDTSDTSGDPKSYPAVGIYQIELSTAPSVQAMVLPDIKPTKKQVKLVARLRYNGGKNYSQDEIQGVYLWSQDAICLLPTDKFRIVVSNDADDTATTAKLNAASSSPELILKQYFGYNNLTTDDCPAYAAATNSPRKIRLEIVS